MSKSEKHNFCNNSVKLNARNVITAIGFLIANEYLIFCGITRLLIKKFFNLHILKNSRNFCDKFKRIPRAHDKLSIKFKEIAVGSKNLTGTAERSNESNVLLDAIRSKLERKQCVYRMIN
ncbi:unnamed protein product [Rhizophagus irregularis]|nr:unnamed protein product [Rhizophagus irregularis]